jgi:hypothetical protein
MTSETIAGGFPTICGRMGMSPEYVAPEEKAYPSG